MKYGVVCHLLALSTLFNAVICSRSVVSSFERDVVKHAEQRALLQRHNRRDEGSLQDVLLSKAVPLKEYEEQLHSSGATIQRHVSGGNDDYYMDEDYMYSFSGYSLKYAKCQTIQRFSEDAIKNGEYSAMVKDDIVILRLCPQRVCSSSKQFGCHYNYAEYAIGLNEYLRIMIKYTVDKRRKLCEFCTECSSGNARALNDGENNNDKDGDGNQDKNNGENNNDRNENNGGDNQQNQEDNNKQEGENNKQENNNNDENNNNGGGENKDNQEAEAAADDGGAADDGDDETVAAATEDVENGDDTGQDSTNSCDTYQSACSDIASWCDDESDDGNYLGLLDYLDYLTCGQIEGQGNYNGKKYWVRPYCDPYKEVIKMAPFYDPYCSQYAGNEVNLKDFSGIYFQTSLFESFYSSTCVDCSESSSPPYYDANSYMCNNIHAASAKCTSNMVYDLFDDYENDSTQCSFIESARFGTYNEKGEINVNSAIFGDASAQEVTPVQTAVLVSSILLCVGLGIYSCYLHHAITNLLFQSLSDGSLLPPSRHSRQANRSSSRTGRSRNGRSARSTSNRSVRSGSKRSRIQDDNEDSDWDRTVGTFT